MENSLSFELVIPCFNEAKSLPSLIETSVRQAKLKGLRPDQFKLVLVDNGSFDETKELLKKLENEEQKDWFRVVSLEKNAGYGGGILAGLKSTSASTVGFTHADLQCDLKDAIEAFFDCVNSDGKILVKGRRVNRKIPDWVVSRIYELTVGALWGFWCYELNAQPKVFHRNLVEKLDLAPSGIPFDAFVLFAAKNAGFLIKNRRVNLSDRVFGESHWSNGIGKRIKTFLRVFQELKECAPTAQ